MAGRFPVCEKVCGKGQDLVNQGHTARGEIGSRIRSLMDKWKQLQDLAKARRTKLEDSIEAHQVRVIILLSLLISKIAFKCVCTSASKIICQRTV